MSTPEGTGAPDSSTTANFVRRLAGPAKVLVVSSVMFTFISYWRTAAVVLCDLASTAYYIGGIVEGAIGAAAPFFILAVMIFSYFVRMIYLESCSLFVRGGVYRVVKEAMGGFLGKLSVSALMFDYVLTGPISGVSAGQYVVGLSIDTLNYFLTPDGGAKVINIDKDTVNLFAAVFAVGVTLYFFRQNIIGIHESSDKALKIMIITTIMGAVIIAWCGVTIIVRWNEVDAAGHPAINSVPITPHYVVKPVDEPEATKKEVVVDPALGFLAKTEFAQKLSKLSGRDWLSVLGTLGIAIAFGHSILAMSGEETLAQVYREVESPKMKNFKKAAFVVFIYSIVLTGGISFLAVMIIPNDLRTGEYKDNLIGGLAMTVIGPMWAKLLLNVIVVLVGSLILSGAVNTSIIGSNGVLNRVAEDGVMPDWFLKPHPKFGTTYRLLYLVTGMQLLTILISRGKVELLGEAYAFGVVWSFVFIALAMVVLRFKNPGPREYKVPLNLRIGGREIPFGLLLIFFVLLSAALLNLLTKEIATISGIAFTLGFLVLFIISEKYNTRRLGHHVDSYAHLEQFNRESATEVTPQALGLSNRYRKLVAIRSPQNLFMLEKALVEADPLTTEIIVMTAKYIPPGAAQPVHPELDVYDQQLMTAVVKKAELAGKVVKPMIVPTNNPLHAVLQTAKDLQVQELVVGGSNKYTADEQMEQIAFYWISLHHGQPAPLTVRIMTRDRDMALDLGGGSRIPKVSEAHARSVAELRAAGVGVDRVLLLHDGSPSGSDLFQSVLTMLDPQIALTLVPIVREGTEIDNGRGRIEQDHQRAEKLGRAVATHEVGGDVAVGVVKLAQADQYDLIIVPLPSDTAVRADQPLDAVCLGILRHAHCAVFVAATPLIPLEVVDTTQSPG
jgi:amino acid transporter